MVRQSTASVSAGDICEQLWLLVKSFKSGLARLAEQHGLTAMQFGVLHAISEGHDTMGKAAKAMRCDASNITGISDRLVALGYVVRQESLRDRRVKSLLLTPQGSAVLQSILRQLPAETGCNALSAAERLTLCGLIRRLHAGNLG